METTLKAGDGHRTRDLRLGKPTRENWETLPVLTLRKVCRRFFSDNQTRLAGEIGVSSQYICMVLSGKRKLHPALANGLAKRINAQCILRPDNSFAFQLANTTPISKELA